MYFQHSSAAAYIMENQCICYGLFLMNKSVKDYGHIPQIWIVWDFYLWGSLEEEVYRNNPCTLQNEIQNVILEIMEGELKVRLLHWCEIWLDVGGLYFQELL
jgi:hypothetical protein